MTEPLVSVIVATYRREDTLRDALDSLRKQTYRNFEIILVDDNDLDAWNEKVERISQTFSRENPEITLRCIANHPHLGSAEARNAGVAIANGEYVTFLDDDDIYLPEKIAAQVLTMAAYSADYSVTDLDLYYTNEKLSEHRVHSYITSTDRDSLFKYHLLYHLTGTDTMMFRCDYLQRIGGFGSIDVGDEFDLMLKAIDGGGKFIYLNRCDVKAYVHIGDEGLSSGARKIHGENRLFALKKKYFAGMNSAEIRYIKVRHYAVLAFAGLRMKRPIYAFQNGVRSFAADPVQCVRLCFERRASGNKTVRSDTAFGEEKYDR